MTDKKYINKWKKNRRYLKNKRVKKYNTKLPTSIIYIIFPFINDKSVIINISMVCKKFYEVSKSFSYTNNITRFNMVYNYINPKIVNNYHFETNINYTDSLYFYYSKKHKKKIGSLIKSYYEIKKNIIFNTLRITKEHFIYNKLVPKNISDTYNTIFVEIPHILNINIYNMICNNGLYYKCRKFKTPIGFNNASYIFIKILGRHVLSGQPSYIKYINIKDINSKTLEIAFRKGDIKMIKLITKYIHYNKNTYRNFYRYNNSILKKNIKAIYRKFVKILIINDRLNILQMMVKIGFFGITDNINNCYGISDINLYLNMSIKYNKLYIFKYLYRIFNYGYNIRKYNLNRKYYINCPKIKNMIITQINFIIKYNNFDILDFIFKTIKYIKPTYLLVKYYIKNIKMYYLVKNIIIPFYTKIGIYKNKNIILKNYIKNKKHKIAKIINEITNDIHDLKIEWDIKKYLIKYTASI